MTGNGLKDPDTALQGHADGHAGARRPGGRRRRSWAWSERMLGDSILPAGLTASAVVAASSANLGPGFDSLGLALSLYDEIVVETTESGLLVEVEGEGAGQVPLGPEHLVVRAIERGLRAAGVAATGPDGPLPQRHSAFARPRARRPRRSSAASPPPTVLWRSRIRSRLTEAELIQLSSEFEGHPDNAVGRGARRRGGVVDRDRRARRAAYFGGAVAAAPRHPPFPGHPRGTLARPPRPGCCCRTQVSHADARFNVSRAALLVVALTERPDLLMAATEDVLHQPQRAPAMPPSAEYLQLLRRCGVAAVLSGAGPAVFALTTQPELPAEVARVRRRERIRRQRDDGRRGRALDARVWRSALSRQQHRVNDGFLLPAGSGLSSVPSSNRSVSACADTRTTTNFLFTRGLTVRRIAANPGDHRCIGDGGTQRSANRLSAPNPRMTRYREGRKEIRDRYGPHHGRRRRRTDVQLPTTVTAQTPLRRARSGRAPARRRLAVDHGAARASGAGRQGRRQGRLRDAQERTHRRHP